MDQGARRLSVRSEVAESGSSHAQVRQSGSDYQETLVFIERKELAPRIGGSKQRARQFKVGPNLLHGEAGK